MFILFLVPISFGLVVVSCLCYFCTCAVFSSILYFHVSCKYEIPNPTKTLLTIVHNSLFKATSNT